MNNKLLPFYSLVISTGLLFFTSNANAENVFTSSASKAGNAAKIITPDKFFIEGALLEIGGDSQVYGAQSSKPYAIEIVNNNASGAFRTGIGYNIASDKELKISYFRLKTDDRDSTQEAGSAFYANDNCCNVDYNSAYVEFEHEINSIDIEIAKTKIVSNNLNLQISGGLKYANYERTVSALYYGNGFDSNGDLSTSRSTFKGFGPKVGIEADYKIAAGFSVFGGADVALVAGSLNFYRNSVMLTDLVAFRNKDNNVVPILAGDFGVKWSKSNIIGNNDFAVKIGYHIESWQSAIVDAYTMNGDNDVSVVDYKDLTLSGAYLRTTFSF